MRTKQRKKLLYRCKHSTTCLRHLMQTLLLIWICVIHKSTVLVTSRWMRQENTRLVESVHRGLSTCLQDKIGVRGNEKRCGTIPLLSRVTMLFLDSDQTGVTRSGVTGRFLRR